MIYKKYSTRPSPKIRLAKRNRLLIKKNTIPSVNYFATKTPLNLESNPSSPLDLDQDREELAKEYLDRYSDFINRQSENMPRIITKIESNLKQEFEAHQPNVNTVTKKDKLQITDDFLEIASIEEA